MDDYHDTERTRTNDQESLPLKSWTTPRLVRMGSVGEVTSTVGTKGNTDGGSVGGHRRSKP